MPPRIRGFLLTRLQQSPAYDLAMRLPILAWSVILAFVVAIDLEKSVQAADSALPGIVYTLNTAMRLAITAGLIILAATGVVRELPIRKAPRPAAAFSFIREFLITALVVFPRRDLSPTTGCVSTLLVLMGDLIATVVLIQLRGSFSIMPEARQLTTSGAYRLVRHPLYLAEEVAAIGAALQFLCIWTVMLLIVQIACQIRSMGNEEMVLVHVFPEYLN
jgi:protein-S-isoprenylcysteine O-methyltransferase Ste14